MPKQRMDLRMIKDIIRLKWKSQLSHEQIAKALNVSKGVVSKYVSLAGSAGLDWDAAQALDERQLPHRLLPRANAAGRFVEPNWAAIHRELDRKGVTLVLLWQEYQAANAEHRTWGYTQFCAHYKDFVARLKRSIRQHRRAGEKLFIDFAGPSVPLLDGSRAQVFVAAMAASSCVFACATPTQRLDDWIEGVVRALAFYDGVPQLIVPDNPRALIAEPDRYEPRANATVQYLCRHYGTSVLPARPRQGQGHGRERRAGGDPLGARAAAASDVRDGGRGRCGGRRAVGVGQREVLPEARRQLRQRLRRAGRAGP